VCLAPVARFFLFFYDLTVIRAVLFDKDGTLFDFRRTWLPVMRRATLEVTGNDPNLADSLLRAAGYDPLTDIFVPDGPIAAGNAADIARAWSPVLPESSPEEMESIVDRYSVEEGPLRSVPVCDLPVLLDRLERRGIRSGVVTSDSEEGARMTLERFGILGRFVWIAGYDSGGAVKPDPEVVREFARRAGVAVGSVAVVGDTLHDMNMGREAGAGLVVAVLTGAVSAAVLESLADVVIPSIEVLPDVIDTGEIKR
jgi:phosphoglycolate phosphatase